MKPPNYPPLFGSPEEFQFYKSFYSTMPTQCLTYNYFTDIDRDTLDIYVITFNNLFCVEYQIKTLRRFVKQKFNIIIVDNNNDDHPDISQKVLEICRNENLTYIKTPNNLYQQPGKLNPSVKLGTTMNWLFLNCARHRKAKYFGYLDQDCFLFENLDLREYLDTKHMYGPISISNKPPYAWNLHVTSNFYRFDFVKDLQLDFRPSHKLELDTGGANWEIIYKNLNYKDYELDTRGFKYFTQDIGGPNTFQYYTLHDHRWFHMCGSTEVNGVKVKEAYCKGWLDCILGREDKAF